MQRSLRFLMAAALAATWFGCAATESETPVAQQTAQTAPSTDDPAAPQVIEVSLSVPNMV